MHLYIVVWNLGYSRYLKYFINKHSTHVFQTKFKINSKDQTYVQAYLLAEYKNEQFQLIALIPILEFLYIINVKFGLSIFQTSPCVTRQRNEFVLLIAYLTESHYTL
jgi:hypothetical protein